MAENPFGDSENTETKQHYLVLLSAGKDNLSMVQTIVQNIKKAVDSKADPLWIDSKGLGIFLEADLVASEIWNHAVSGLSHEQIESVKDMLIVEIGSDWAARRDARPEHWLTRHVGSPRIAPHDRQRR